MVLDDVARGCVLLRGVPSPMPMLMLRLMLARMPMREATIDVDAALILYGAISPRRQRASVRCACAFEQLGGNRAGDESKTLTATSCSSAVNGADVADGNGENEAEIADGIEASMLPCADAAMRQRWLRRGCTNGDGRWRARGQIATPRNNCRVLITEQRGTRQPMATVDATEAEGCPRDAAASCDVDIADCCRRDVDTLRRLARSCCIEISIWFA